MKNCDMTQAVLAIVILVLALWPNLFGATASKWLIVIGAAWLLIRACAGPKHMAAAPVMAPVKRKTAGKKRRKRK